MMERTTLSGHERAALEHLLAFLAMAGSHGQGLKARLRTIPYGWRDWMLMMTLARKLYEEMQLTLTDSQLRQMKLLEQFGECKITMKRATRQEHDEFVSVKAIKQLMNTCIGSECAICVRDEQQTRGCALRKAMYEIAPPLEIPRFGCGYRDVALEAGEE